MFFKLVVLCATLAYTQAGGLIASAPAIATYSAPSVTTTYHGSPAFAQYAAAAPAVPLSYSSAPAITSQSSNILRSFGNLGQISTYSKSIDTPFSSVRKADIRVSNPGLRISAAPAYAYSAPTLTYSPAHAVAYSAPTHALTYSAPAHTLTYSAPAHAVHGIGVAYSAAPAVSHISYASPYATYGW